MLRMCRPIFGTGKAVVLEGWFCVVNGIVEIESKGVYAGSLIKKHLYWKTDFMGILLILTFKIRGLVILNY